MQEKKVSSIYIETRYLRAFPIDFNLSDFVNAKLKERFGSVEQFEKEKEYYEIELQRVNQRIKEIQLQNILDILNPEERKWVHFETYIHRKGMLNVIESKYASFVKSTGSKLTLEEFTAAVNKELEDLQ
jgi:hypothetical protein